MDPTEYEQLVEYKVRGEYPPNFNRRQKQLLRRKAALYEVEGEELFYWRYKDTPQTHKTKVIKGAEEARATFTDLHADHTEAHCGQKKTREELSKTFYWPAMSEDIKQWVSQCSGCQARKQQAEYTSVQVSRPFELVGMDLIENLPQTAKGHQYICVIMDYLTRWAEAYPLKTNSEQEVVQCLIKFVYRFSAPEMVATSQRRELVNSINKEVCKALNIERSLSFSSQPQIKGLVNKMKRTIQRALSKVVGSRPDTWDEHLDAVMFGLRTKKQASTQYSPFYLMFGREALHPEEVPEHYPINATVEEVMGRDMSDYVLRRVKEMETLRESVSKKTRKIKVQKKIK